MSKRKLLIILALMYIISYPYILTPERLVSIYNNSNDLIKMGLKFSWLLWGAIITNLGIYFVDKQNYEKNFNKINALFLMVMILLEAKSWAINVKYLYLSII